MTSLGSNLLGTSASVLHAGPLGWLFAGVAISLMLLVMVHALINPDRSLADQLARTRLAPK
jgi:hypothetical protein